MTCQCGLVLDQYWVCWDEKNGRWTISPEWPHRSADAVYAASLAEAAYAIHHDPSVLEHDWILPSGDTPGYRLSGQHQQVPETKPAAPEASPISEAFR